MKIDSTTFIVLFLIIFFIYAMIQLALEKLGVTDQFFYIGAYTVVTILAMVWIKNSKE